MLWNSSMASSLLGSAQGPAGVDCAFYHVRCPKGEIVHCANSRPVAVRPRRSLIGVLGRSRRLAIRSLLFSLGRFCALTRRRGSALLLTGSNLVALGSRPALLIIRQRHLRTSLRRRVDVAARRRGLRPRRGIARKSAARSWYPVG